MIQFIISAMELLNGTETNPGETITVTLAKPDDPNNKLKKMKRHQMRTGKNFNLFRTGLTSLNRLESEKKLI